MLDALIGGLGAVRLGWGGIGGGGLVGLVFLPLTPLLTSLFTPPLPLNGASRDELRLMTSQLSVFSKSVSLAFCACAPFAARRLSLMSELELIGGNELDAGPFPPAAPPPAVVFGGRGGREGESVISVAAVASDVRGGKAGGFLGGTGGVTGEYCAWGDTNGVAARDAGRDGGCATPLKGFLDLRNAPALSAVSDSASSRSLSLRSASRCGGCTCVSRCEIADRLKGCTGGAVIGI